MITGFENSAIAGDQSVSDIAPLAEMEHHSHESAAPLSELEHISELDPPDANDASSIGTGTPSMLEDLQLEEMPSLELPSLELEDDDALASELPMLDVPFDEAEDEAPLGGSLTFISLDAPVELERCRILSSKDRRSPEIEAAPESMYERQPDMLIEHRDSSPVSLDDDFGVGALDVERSPSFEMEAIIPDGGKSLPMLDEEDEEEEEEETSEFDRDNALSGLPMLDPDQFAPMAASDARRKTRRSS